MTGSPSPRYRPHLPLFVAAVLMVFAAVMLVSGIGASGLWIAVIAVGVAVVVISRTRGPQGLRR